MANIALALAFAVSSLFSPGGRILRMAVDGPVLQSLPPYQGHLLLALANYWIPAVLAYLLLRLARADGWLRPSKAIHGLLGLANILIVLYVAVSIFASTVEGGGASFVVMSFAPFIIWPAWSLLVIGFSWLAVRSIRNRNEPTQSRPHTFGIGDAIALIAALGIPASVVASTFYLADDAPFRLSKEAEALFNERCKSAAEKIIEAPQDVQSVYLEPDGGEYFNNIVNSVYSGHGSSILGEPLVNGGLLRYFEKRNNRQRLDGSTAKYRKHVQGDWKGEPVEELTSEYGIFQKALTSDNDGERLGVRGTEVTVKNLRTGQIVATRTFFTSKRHRTICGHSGDGNFGMSEFVQRSLNLTRRVPNPSPQESTRNR